MKLCKETYGSVGLGLCVIELGELGRVVKHLEILPLVTQPFPTIHQGIPHFFLSPSLPGCTFLSSVTDPDVFDTVSVWGCSQLGFLSLDDTKRVERGREQTRTSCARATKFVIGDHIRSMI